MPEKVAQSVLQKFGKINVLINNAGIHSSHCYFMQS